MRLCHGCIDALRHDDRCEREVKSIPPREMACERCKEINPCFFVDVGVGVGEISGEPEAK
jgi:hypothetical protein